MEALNAKGCEVLTLAVVGYCEAEVECWVVSPTNCEFKKAKSCSHCDLEIGYCGFEKADSSPV